ncbi:MAG: hypothetical protein QM692_07535 [Thermomicrobiales bacterium]
MEHYRAEVRIDGTPAGIPDLDYLDGAELGTLLDRERLATAWALTEAKRPNLMLTIPTNDAAIVGEFYFMHEFQTVVAGGLYGVNPFGQPGVEAGKNATYALMGREGYEELRATLTRSLRGRITRRDVVLEPESWALRRTNENGRGDCRGRSFCVLR